MGKLATKKLNNGALSTELEVMAHNLAHKERMAYPNNEVGITAFREKTLEYIAYLKQVDEDPDLETIIPDIEGWTHYLGISRQMLHKYRKRSEEWQMLIDETKNGIASIKKQLAFKGITNPVFAIFDLTNNHDYVNSNEFKITQQNNEVERRVLTADEIRKKYGKHEGFIDGEYKEVKKK